MLQQERVTDLQQLHSQRQQECKLHSNILQTQKLFWNIFQEYWFQFFVLVNEIEEDRRAAEEMRQQAEELSRRIQTAKADMYNISINHFIQIDYKIVF